MFDSVSRWMASRFAGPKPSTITEVIYGDAYRLSENYLSKLPKLNRFPSLLSTDMEARANLLKQQTTKAKACPRAKRVPPPPTTGALQCPADEADRLIYYSLCRTSDHDFELQKACPRAKREPP